MAIVRPISESQASTEVKTIFEEIRKFYDLDYTPSAVRALARDPERLKQTWQWFQRGTKTWDKEMFTLINLAVSVVTNCEYSINFETAVLKQLGYDDNKIEQVISHISFTSGLRHYYNGLQLEPDVTPDTVARRIAA